MIEYTTIKYANYREKSKKGVGMRKRGLISAQNQTWTVEQDARKYLIYRVALLLGQKDTTYSYSKIYDPFCLFYTTCTFVQILKVL